MNDIDNHEGVSTDLGYTSSRDWRLSRYWNMDWIKVPSLSSKVLVMAVFVLGLIGLVVLASASQSFSQEHGHYFKKQLIFGVIGCVMAYCLMKLDLEHARSYVGWMSVGVFILLVIVLIPGIGITVNGARRWLDLGPIRIQVSEFGKLIFVALMAHYLALNQHAIKRMKEGFLIPMMIIGLVCGLIIIEPDFGTAFLCGLVGFSLLFLAGTPLKYLVPCICSGLIVFGIAVFLNPVRLKRITSFLDVEANKMDGAYQLWQGILAFGAGGIDGVGIGNGRQQIAFLPEAHTDFIFPIIGEELGIFFTMGVALLFFIIFLVGVIEVRKAPDMYSFLLGVGSLLVISLQALMNMGVVMGLLPTKGISLPFISYGGSNLIVMACFVGILLNCFRRWNSLKLKKVREL